MIRRVPNPTLLRFLDAPGRFAIFGASSVGHAVFSQLVQSDAKPEAFLDSRRRGNFEGLPILQPEAALELCLERVVTASMFAREMALGLRALGFEGAILDLSVARFSYWTQHFDTSLPERCALELRRARESFADDASRAIFDAVLAHRRSLDPCDLPDPSPEYRHPALPVRPGETVLDVGAYDGSTSIDYAQAVAPEGRVYAFEPSLENFDLLRRRVAHDPRGRRVRPHPVGCWSRSGRLALRTEGREPSQFQISSQGDETINVVSIDDIVADERIGRVDWIKLDVEGAEHEVLLGARETLRAYRPKLAVCVYHRPRDLWELPAQLLDLGLGYRLFLAHHSQNLYDTVCYALPREKS